MDITSEKDWDLKLNSLKDKAKNIKIPPAGDAYEQTKQKAILKDKEQICHYYRTILNIKDLLSKIIQETINDGKFSISIGTEDSIFKFPAVQNSSSAMRKLCDQEFSTNQKLADEIIEWLLSQGYKANYKYLINNNNISFFKIYNFTISWAK